MTRHAAENLKTLAEVIANTVKGVRPARIQLRVIESPKPTLFDSITRASVLRRIRDLNRMYQLGWLVNQCTFNTPGLDCLEDAELSALLSEMERARECLVDGVAFDDVGLIRSNAADLPCPAEDQW